MGGGGGGTLTLIRRGGHSTTPSGCGVEFDPLLLKALLFQSKSTNLALNRTPMSSVSYTKQNDGDRNVGKE